MRLKQFQEYSLTHLSKTHIKSLIYFHQKQNIVNNVNHLHFVLLLHKIIPCPLY